MVRARGQHAAALFSKINFKCLRGALIVGIPVPYIFGTRGGIFTLYIGNWELDSKYIGNWKIRDMY